MKELRDGGTFGVVSPASSPDESIYRFSHEFFESRGFRVKIFGMGEPGFGRMAASDQARLSNLHAAFRDPDVDAIICTRGGYGTLRLLDGLDHALIQRTDKIFVGYSDITNLLFTFNAKSGLVPFHGPMLADFMSKEDDWTVDRFFNTLTNSSNSYALGRADFQPVRTGQGRGTLFGGNITTLQCLAGTEDLRSSEPRILLLEDVGEYMYRLDRALVHLRRCGFFENLAGVLFADMQLKDRTEENSLGINLEDLIEMHFGDLDCPIAIDLPCGHTGRQMTVPFGVETTVEVTETALSIVFDDFWSNSKGKHLVA